MKRLWGALLVLALALGALPARADGPVTITVYLPIMGSADMSQQWALLQLTDGTTTVNLLQSDGYGFHLDNWNPAIPQMKGGGVWQDSPLAEGRRLVDGKFGNVTDSMDFDVNGRGQAQTIAESVKLLQLLEKARDFGKSDWQTEPVWLVRRLACEDNAQYALVYDYKLASMADPFAAPFYAASEIANMDGFALGFEHSIWLGNQPGASTCVQASGAQIGWSYTGWQKVTANRTSSLVQSTTGRIFAGEDGQISQSDDDGATWALSTALPVNDVTFLLQTTTGRILAAEAGNIWKTDNDGVAWAAVAAPPGGAGTVSSIIQLAASNPMPGRLLLADGADVFSSDDDGENWTALSVGGGTQQLLSLVETATGRVLCGGTYGEIWYSDDGGTTWGLLVNGFSGEEVYSLFRLADDRILAGGSVYTQIWISSDDGASWSLLNPTSTMTNNVLTFVQLASGTMYAGTIANDGVIISNDLYSWSSFFTTPLSVYALIETTVGSLLAGDNWAGAGGLYRLAATHTTNLGQITPTCSDQVFLANKQNVANITDVYIDDGGAWSANLFPFALPEDLLPAAPAIDDALYVGINTAVVNSGPFESLVWDLANIITFTNSYTVIPEVWTGAAWVTLAMQDGTNPGTGMFRTLGISSMHWEPPAGWVTRALNLDGGPAVTGYWVRFRVSALAGAMTAPSQQNRDIYSIVLPYADVAASQVIGDIPALARFKLTNRSDKDGGSNPPYLHDNRIAAGLRSYDRGPAFTPFLNASDEQNPLGMTVTVGANTIIAAGVTGITGRLATYTGDGLATWSDEVTFELGPTVARDFYGSFHAFVRAKLDGAGVSSDIHARLQVRTGSGGVMLTTDDDYLKSINDFEVLDLGRITIPASGVLAFTDLGDSTELVIQMRDDSAGGLVNLIHDLILVPVDEWQMDAVDMANITLSIIGRQAATPHLLDIDSVGYSKVDIRTPVRTADGNAFVTAIYLPNSPGPAILQANAHQRLWVFAMRTTVTGTDPVWLAPPWIAHSIQIWKNERFLGFRGQR